jgi:hypothetical protein
MWSIRLLCGDATPYEKYQILSTWLFPSPLRIAAILVIGCIDYAFDKDELRHHQTRFIFEITKRGQNGASLPIDPRAGDAAQADIGADVNPNLSDDAD